MTSIYLQLDVRVRQFGSNTCEVGYGLPSGHMQVLASKNTFFICY